MPRHRGTHGGDAPAGGLPYQDPENEAETVRAPLPRRRRGPDATGEPRWEGDTENEMPTLYGSGAGGKHWAHDRLALRHMGVQPKEQRPVNSSCKRRLNQELAPGASSNLS